METPMPTTSSADLLEGSLPLMGGQSPQSILLRALWVLRDPNRWARTYFAEDADRKWVPNNDPRAVRWSIEGAVAMACNSAGVLPPFFMKLLDETSMELYREDSVTCLEEYCYHGHVVQVLLRAAEKCGEMNYGEG
jgi:hypothetical protein